MHNKLIKQAIIAREYAYAPYSSFQVGAAVLTEEGEIITGCNIENSSYSLTCCAERVAIFSAVAQGKKNFAMMAIVADTERPIQPCGACRQVMAQFFDRTIPIYLANLNEKVAITTIEKLLPESFHL